MSDEAPPATPGTDAPPAAATPSEARQRIDALIARVLPKLEELVERFLNPPKPAEGAGIASPFLRKLTERDLARFACVPLVALTERSGVLYAARADGAVFYLNGDTWLESMPVPGTIAALPPEPAEEPTVDAGAPDGAPPGSPPPPTE